MNSNDVGAQNTQPITGRGFETMHIFLPYEQWYECSEQVAWRI